MLCLGGCASAYPPYMAIQGAHWAYSLGNQFDAVNHAETLVGLGIISFFNATL